MAIAERITEPETTDLDALVEAERSVIAALLADPTIHPRLARLVSGEAFTDNLHRGLFERVGEFLADGRTPRLSDLLDEVIDVGVGGVPSQTYLARLAADRSRRGDPEHAARHVAREARARAARGDGLAYETDVHAWAFAQGERLRRGTWLGLDALNLAEEIESLGNELAHKLESAYRIVLLHFLKWDHQPERRSRSWTLSIREYRTRVRILLDRSPSLTSRTTHAIRDAYELARLQATRETGLDETVFPAQCPYSVEAIMGRPIAWPPT